MKYALSLLLLCWGSSVYALDLTSSDISQGQIIGSLQVHNEWGCKGQSLSPELQWADVPEGTKSFAVTVYDTQTTSSDSGWWHWLIFDIAGDVRVIKRGAGNAGLHITPEGSRQTITDLAKPGFHGVCPDEGSGVHHYRFTVHALDVEKLPVEGVKTMPAEVSYFINLHTIEKAIITAPFQR